MSERETATGQVGLIQDFVNTLDLRPRDEQLKDPNTLKDWLVARGFLDASAEVVETDHKHALALREAIRGVIGANNGQAVYPVDLATLNEAAVASRLRMRFGADGKARLEPEVSGVIGALGRIVATLYAAMQEEDWERLKLCNASDCRWAFYDQSKNHSSRWCTMASCGNRQKARRFREKEKASSAPALG